MFGQMELLTRICFQEAGICDATSRHSRSQPLTMCLRRYGVTVVHAQAVATKHREEEMDEDDQEYARLLMQWAAGIFVLNETCSSLMVDVMSIFTWKIGESYSVSIRHASERSLGLRWEICVQIPRTSNLESDNVRTRPGYRLATQHV
jgi:hypothetical protein